MLESLGSLSILPPVITAAFLAITVFTPVITCAQTVENVEILSLDFSSATEALKHIDNSTECYDSGGDGTAKEYVDSTNGWFVFEGDNTDTSSGYDNPIAVVQGYDEAGGFNSYAVIPYNYTVQAGFMTPSTPGSGNFYILPRYGNVNNKYEVVVDIEGNNLVFNKMVGGSWTNIKTTPLGLTISTGTWYTFTVEVRWEYNSSEGGYTNHIIATVTNGSNTVNDEIWDSDIPPSSYNGLAFLGFDGDEEFKVYMDNVVVKAEMEKVGEEPDESSASGWGGTCLDVREVYVYSDSDNVFILIETANSISTDSASTEYWAMQFDLDRDSRNTALGWDFEYYFITKLDTDGSSRSDLYDGNGNWLGRLHTLGGGVGYDYLAIQIPKSELEGLGSSLYLYGYTKLGDVDRDGFPRDDVSGKYRTGDYYVWYLAPPYLAWSVEILDTDVGDQVISSDHLNITYIREEHDLTNIYFELEVDGVIPWNGGDTSGIYDILIDADHDTGTGYLYTSLQDSEIGADYLLEIIPGYVAKLFKFAGENGTTDWSWEFLKREEPIHSPGGSSYVRIVTPKSDYTYIPLEGSIKFIGTTSHYDSSEEVTILDDDSSDPQPAPVPEPLISVLAVILVALLITIWRAFNDSENP